MQREPLLGNWPKSRIKSAPEKIGTSQGEAGAKGFGGSQLFLTMWYMYGKSMECKRGGILIKERGTEGSRSRQRLGAGKISSSGIAAPFQNAWYPSGSPPPPVSCSLGPLCGWGTPHCDPHQSGAEETWHSGRLGDGDTRSSIYSTFHLQDKAGGRVNQLQANLTHQPQDYCALWQEGPRTASFHKRDPQGDRLHQEDDGQERYKPEPLIAGLLGDFVHHTLRVQS